MKAVRENIWKDFQAAAVKITKTAVSVADTSKAVKEVVTAANAAGVIAKRAAKHAADREHVVRIAANAEEEAAKNAAKAAANSKDVVEVAIAIQTEAKKAVKAAAAADAVQTTASLAVNLPSLSVMI